MLVFLEYMLVFTTISITLYLQLYHCHIFGWVKQHVIRKKYSLSQEYMTSQRIHWLLLLKMSHFVEIQMVLGAIHDRSTIPQLEHKKRKLEIILIRLPQNCQSHSLLDLFCIHLLWTFLKSKNITSSKKVFLHCFVNTSKNDVWLPHLMCTL